MSRKAWSLARNVVWVATLSFAGLLGLLCYILYPPPPRNIVFPEGKRFAFTIVDDTDLATLERVRPLYALLDRYGMRTTKTVWVLESTEPSHSPNLGDSLSDAEYRRFVMDLQSKGFEIALHGVRGGSSVRKDIVKGLEQFRSIVGDYPRVHVNHSFNRDNVYWGRRRWSFPPFRWLYSLLKPDEFSGDEPTSPYFWGDLLRERIDYVNQFTFSDINLLDVTPNFPYHLPDKPLVNLWFPTANGDNLDALEILLSPENVDRLEREGGVSLVYAHLGAGSFNDDDGGVDPRFEALIRNVARHDGWFATASEILDLLREQPGWTAEPSWRERIRLEVLFIWDLVAR